MFNNQKIIYGFNDLCVLPVVQNTDRKVVPNLDGIRQKNGRSRFLVSLFDKSDLEAAKQDKEHMYVARYGEVSDRIELLLDRECSHIIPEFNIVEFINEKKFIESLLVESKDKFNIILNILDMTPMLFHLRSAELNDYLSMFHIVYRVYPCSEIIRFINELHGYGIIIDSSVKEVELKANASVIAEAANAIMGMFGDRRFRDADLFEQYKFGNYATLSTYNDLDPAGTKSFSLGSQFIVVEKPDVRLQDILAAIGEFEKKNLTFLSFINATKFSSIQECSECCLISRY